MDRRWTCAAVVLAFLVATIAPVSAQGTPTLSIADISVTEGNSGTTTAQVTVTKSGSTSQFVSVDFEASDETATFSDGDYHDTNGTLSFSPSETTETITVTIVGDTVDESDETFVIELSDANNATIADGTGRVTIVDNDAPVVVSIGDTSVVEGDSGTNLATFTISLSRAVSDSVGVSYATSDGTATFADGDFHQTSGTIFFSPGQTSRTITVQVDGDTIDEGDETFFVTLSNPQGVVLGDSTGEATIVDNDSAVVVSIGDTSVVEGDSGTNLATFTVSLSRAVSDSVGVSYATSDGSATFADGDFHQTTGTIFFSPGQTSRTITVQVDGDTTDENDETFFVTLTNPQGVVLGDSTGQATIIDNDGSGGGGGGGGGSSPTVSITDQSVTEGNTGTTSMTFTVSLSSADTGTVRVDYETLSGTATEGQDFTSASGELVFAAGETSKTVTVPIIGDLVDEDNETFSLFLPRVQGATFADSSGEGTIADDDATPTLSVSDVSTLEGDAGTSQVTVTLTLSGPSGEFVSVDLQTLDGTATFADADFHSTSGTIVFQPGQTQRTLDLTVVGDENNEPDEFFTVELSDIDGATLGDGSARIEIRNDDSTDPTAPADSTTTLTVVNDPDRLIARGRVIPMASGEVVVKLLRKRGGRFVLVQRKRPQLKERPGASTPHSAYRTTLRKPNGGRCRIIVTYPGSSSFEASSARATFRC